MIQKISALDVAFEKTALIERLINPESTVRAVVGATAKDVGGAFRSALNAHSLARDAKTLVRHGVAEAPQTIPGRGAAFMGHLRQQEAARQHDLVSGAKSRMLSSGHVTEYAAPQRGPSLPDHMAPATMAQAHSQIAGREAAKAQAANAASNNGGAVFDITGYHPSVLLGGAGLVGGAAASENHEDLPRNLAVGAGAGVLGGMGLRQLKHASLNPTMNIGPLGMGIRPDTERLPGTYRSVPTSVIQRVGEGMDQGMSPDEAVQHGAAAPEIGTAPVMGTVLGATAGHYLGGGMKGLLLGGALGYGAGALAKGQMQKQYQQDARTALQGLAIERARMGIR